MVVHENALKHALLRLGGTRLVFSNAPRHYVEEVLRAIGLARYFDAVYTIEDTGYRGKPHAWGFHRLLRKHNLDPHRCAHGRRHARTTCAPRIAWACRRCG